MLMAKLAGAETGKAKSKIRRTLKEYCEQECRRIYGDIPSICSQEETLDEELEAAKKLAAYLRKFDSKIKELKKIQQDAGDYVQEKKRSQGSRPLANSVHDINKFSYFAQQTIERLDEIVADTPAPQDVRSKRRIAVAHMLRQLRSVDRSDPETPRYRVPTNREMAMATLLMGFQSPSKDDTLESVIERERKAIAESRRALSELEAEVTKPVRKMLIIERVGGPR